MIQVSLPYPISSNLYWRHSGKFVYVSKRALEYRKSVAAICYAYGAKMMEGKVALFVELCPKARKVDTGKPIRVIDLDNCLKVMCDALQGIAFTNDSQIHAISAKYGEPVPGGALNIKVVSA